MRKTTCELRRKFEHLKIRHVTCRSARMRHEISTSKMVMDQIARKEEENV